MMTELEIKQQIEELQQKLKDIKKEEKKSKPKERYFYKFYICDEQICDIYEEEGMTKAKEYYNSLLSKLTLDSDVALDTLDYWKDPKRTKKELLDYITDGEYRDFDEENTIIKRGDPGFTMYYKESLKKFEITGSQLKKAKNGEIECIKLII